jgi:hypothetical protein
MAAVGALLNSRERLPLSDKLVRAAQGAPEGIVPLVDDWAEVAPPRVTANKRFIQYPKKARAYFKTLLARVTAFHEATLI